MRQVPIRELNQRTADVIARVEAGERVSITRNGIPVAILEPAIPDPLGPLIESGELRAATSALPLFFETDHAARDSLGSDAVSADRSDVGRW